MPTQQTMDHSIPVLLLRAVSHGGLCILRSLGSAGIPVYIADSDTRSPASSSRYCRGFFQVDVDHAPASLALLALRDAAKQIGARALLLPTTDVAAQFVADHSKQLQADFLLASPAGQTVRDLSRKISMHALAAAAGIPTPQTRVPAHLDDLFQLASTLTYPVMLKSSEGHLLSSQHIRKPMVILRSAEELISTYQLTDVPNRPLIMVQEYIPGGDDTVWMFDGYFRDGECLFGITGKKIRQSPVYTGATSLGICLRNDAVHRLACDFMRSIHYNGPVDMGFRYDERDGSYRVLDVNPRIGATFRLFVDENGLDLALVIYMASAGQKFTVSAPRWGRKWLVEDNDLVSSLRYYRDRKLTLKQWLVSFRGVEETAYFGHSDFRPCLTALACDLRELARRVRAKFDPPSRVVGPRPSGRTIPSGNQESPSASC